MLHWHKHWISSPIPLNLCMKSLCFLLQADLCWLLFLNLTNQGNWCGLCRRAQSKTERVCMDLSFVVMATEQTCLIHSSCPRKCWLHKMDWEKSDPITSGEYHSAWSDLVQCHHYNLESSKGMSHGHKSLLQYKHPEALMTTKWSRVV